MGYKELKDSYHACDLQVATQGETRLIANSQMYGSPSLAMTRTHIKINSYYNRHTKPVTGDIPWRIIDCLYTDLIKHIVVFSDSSYNKHSKGVFRKGVFTKELHAVQC